MKIQKKKFIALILVITIILLLSFSIVRASSNSMENNITITILHTNDTHGRVKGNHKTIGIDKLSWIKKNTERCLLVDAGDAVHGIPFAILNQGIDIINLMKEAEYDVMTVGNHDFNYNYERLLELRDIAKAGEKNFDIISANILKENKTLLKPNVIKSIDDIKIGFFGLITLEAQYKTNPNNVKGIEFSNPIETAKEQVEDLKSQGADIIIAITHMGVDESSLIKSTDIAEEVKGIDLIIDGHSHTLFKNGYEGGNNTLICSAGEYGENLGVIKITINNESKILQERNAIVLDREQLSSYNVDAEISNKLDKIEKEQSKVLKKVIGRSLVELNGERADVRTKETNLGNLITDAMLYESKAEIAMLSGGGIRTSINKGQVNMENILTTLPFKSYIITKYLTGAEIQEVLEKSVSKYPEKFGGFLHIAGMKFKFDTTKDIGERVWDIRINNEKIDRSRKYLVAITDFLGAGGDEYSILKNIKTEEEFRYIDEILGDYIREIEEIEYSIEGRIIENKIIPFNINF